MTVEVLKVNVSPLTAAAIRKIAARRGENVTETIRRAVAVLEHLEDSIAADTDVRLVEADGTASVLQLVPPAS